MDRIKRYCDSKNINDVLITDIKSFNGTQIQNLKPPSITELQSAAKVWIDASYDPIAVKLKPWSQIISVVKSANKNTKVLSSDFSYWYKTDSEIIYCPFWFLNVYPFRSFEVKDQRRFKFSCLNRELKPHRLMHFCLFYESEYFPHSCIGYYGKATYITYSADQERRIEQMLKFCNDPYITETYNKLKHLVPYAPHEPGYAGYNDHSLNHQAYTNTYINVVTETSCDFTNVFPGSEEAILTEKTVKPLLARQMFIMAAQTGSVQFLRDLGIDMFDDIIDHSYDNIQGFVPKTYAIHAELQRLSKLDLETIFKQNRSRLEANHDRLFDTEFKDLAAKQLITG